MSETKPRIIYVMSPEITQTIDGNNQSIRMCIEVHGGSAKFEGSFFECVDKNSYNQANARIKELKAENIRLKIDYDAHNNLRAKLEHANERIVEFEDIKKGHISVQKSLQAQVDVMSEALCIPDMDCGDNSCRYAKERSGIRTNGGCRCIDGRNRHLIQRLLERQKEALEKVAEIRGKNA